MKLGYSTWGMPTLPIGQAISHIAQLGFEGIEMAVIPGYTTALDHLDSQTRQDIKQWLKNHKLTLSAIAAHSSLVQTDPEIHAEQLKRPKAMSRRWSIPL